MADDTLMPMTAAELRAAIEKARAEGREEGKREALARFQSLLVTTKKLQRRETDLPRNTVDEELDALALTIERRRA